MVEIAVRDVVTDDERSAILDGLVTFNRETAGFTRGSDLLVMAREEGRLAGGLVGRTGHGAAFVELLYVAEPFRGTGLGTRLLDAAEDEARRRGMRQIYLDTFTFQAPGFYMKRGYAEFGRLPDFPPGHDRVWLRKAL